MSGNTSKNPRARATAELGDPELRAILSEIPVGGITPFTTIDFPGRLAGVFYLQGCSWRCRYCYNSELWPFPPGGNRISPDKILSYLKSRQGRLDGIVFSGGEPTAHAGLTRWVKAVKSMGYQVALHTNGMYPDRLGEVLPLCDWVGLDIKAPFDQYANVTTREGSGAVAKASLRRILSSHVPYECRTTVHPDLLKNESLLQLATELHDLGVREFHVQRFRQEGCPDPELRASSQLGAVISLDLQDRLKAIYPKLQVRG